MASPKLRFKEFDGDWKESRLKDLALKITDGTHDTPVVQKEGIPFLTAINVKDGFINYDDIGYVDEITHKKIYERCNPEKDDLLIVNIGAGTATCARNIVDYQFSLKNVALVKPNRNLLNPIFLEQIQRKNSSRLFTSLTSGGAQPFLSLKEIGKLLIKYPSLEEQTKIASFLSSVDEKISQLTQKHQLLSQYKQGMMQKLFSQQIRFKADDGSEFGEWEELTLSQISKHIGGTALESYVSECGDYNFISIGNYSTNGKYIDNSQRIILNEKTGTKLLDKDDLVMVLNDKTATGDLIGSTILINEDNKYIYNQRSERIICNKSKVLSVYLWHFLNSEMMRSEVRKLAQGGTQIYINFSSVLSIIFLLPCLAEQNKIANFLSAIDQKIEVVAQQIEQAKQWKKGLLQQMFV